MSNRIDEVLLDSGNESVPNLGEAAKLLAALPEEISPPKPVGLERWHGRRATTLADGAGFHVTRPLRSLAKHKPLSQDYNFCTPT